MRTIRGSQRKRSRRSVPIAYRLTAERAKTVGRERLNAIVDGTPLTMARQPNIQYPR